MCAEGREEGRGTWLFECNCSDFPICRREHKRVVRQGIIPAAPTGHGVSQRCRRGFGRGGMKTLRRGG